MSRQQKQEKLERLAGAVVAELGSDDEQREERIADAIEAFTNALVVAPSKEVAEGLLGKLRERRRFVDLARVADGLTEVGFEEPFVRRHYAQALIDQGFLEPAQAMLEKSLPTVPGGDKEYGETLGLLGRVHKQRFVRIQADRGRAAGELERAVHYYQKVYPLDPAWAGANLVALVCRAEREGIAAGDLGSEDTVSKVLADLQALPAAEYSHWVEASLGETHLGRGDTERAAKHYGRFIQHEKTDAFAIASAARQLREIWRIEPGEETPGGTILLALDAQTLSKPGGRLHYSPAGLARMSGRLDAVADAVVGTGNAGAVQGGLAGPGPEDEKLLQALLGDNPQVTLKTLLALLRVTPGVCRVADETMFTMDRKSGGTGFVIDGGALGHPRPLLVTNWHVLTEDGKRPSVRRKNAVVVFDYWKGAEKRVEFDVGSILWTSPWDVHDATVAELVARDTPVEEATRCPISSDPAPLKGPGEEPRDKVFIIGHPDGRGLEFSLADNEVIDHDLGDAQPTAAGRRRIHYKAPTERGSSGSPVFDERRFEVIGLHRAVSDQPMRRVPGKDDYRANEAVWIGSIVEAFKQARHS